MAFKILHGGEYFFQWDLGQKLIVEENYCEVHFCNQTEDCALMVSVYEEDGKRVADVPNILLQSTNNIRVYGVCAAGEELINTNNYQVFRVIARGRPEKYEYTEEERLDYKKLSEDFYAALGDINSALEELHTYAEGVKSGGVA